MPNNKNYSIREKVIDRMLHQGWYTRLQIEAACNKELERYSIAPISSKQTIMNDLLTIRRKYNKSIEKKQEGHAVFYRYKDRGFSIYKPELSKEDFNKLKEALNIVKHFRGMPQFEWIDTLDFKLKTGIKRENDNRVKVSFEDSTRNSGIHYFTPIFDAICDKITISIDYQSFRRSEPKEFILSPYFLKEYNNRWFVLGKSPGYERISIYALDRIIHLRNAGVKYEETDVDFESYFDNVVGVTVSDHEVETIRLWVSTHQMNYLETKPLHRSQRLVSKDDTGAVFEFDLIPNFELEQAILAYGEHAKVLEPEALRIKIISRIKKSSKKYE